MSPADEQHVKDILKFFYPDEVPPARISDEVGNLAAEMLNEALTGSKAMDFVPRPARFQPGVGWLISQAVQMAWRRHVSTNVAAVDRGPAVYSVQVRRTARHVPLPSWRQRA